MNSSQIAAQRAQLAADQAAIDADLTVVKSFDGLGAIEARIEDLRASRAELDRAEASLKAVQNHPLSQLGHGAADEFRGAVLDTKALKSGRAVSPLHISEHVLKGLHAAASSRQSLSVKAFSTLEGLLPAQLDPNILGPVHEGRLLDRLPAQQINAPTYEIMVNSSITGSPGPVAEGGLKPELTLDNTPLTLTAIKLAAHLGLGYESIQDFTNFQSFATGELVSQIMDVENLQLLSGDGTNGNMVGFLHTPNILTHDASVEVAGDGTTALDAIEIGITQLRTGNALATADLLILNPATWSAIRRLKDSTGRFLFIASDSDPTRAEANSVFGVPVLVTTQIAAGAGVLLDSTRFGKVLVREGLRLHTGTSGDDLVRNIVRLVGETRLVLAVERPTAVLSLTNLPTV